jgi:glycosyltransferase involved in cell wall biosynthesis
MKLSIIIPCLDEEGNIRPLHLELKPILSSLGAEYEIIFIDDGSSDNSFEAMKELAAEDPRVKIVRFRKTFGQTAALSAGFHLARGDVIIPLDGDLQNDPSDIPRLLAALEDGCDVVSGWRKERKDTLIMRRIPSWMANKLISLISGVKLHDYGCTMKAYRKSILKDVRLYGEMHRFIPIYANWQGGRVREIVVNHRPRVHGKTKYRINRIVKVILDLMVIKFLEKYSQNPIYLFGGFGLTSIFFSMISFAMMIYYKFWGDKTFIETPLPMLTVMFGLIGVVSIMIGLVAEMGTRTYYESQQKDTYQIKYKINF